MATQGEYYPITGDPTLNRPDVKEADLVYTEGEKAEKALVEEMLETKEMYAKARMNKEREWVDSYKMYMSYIDTTRNPFLSNLFIPKTHEAVELLAAFLIGTNQAINASPEGNGDSMKADVAGKYIDFLWRKKIKARPKILTWIKQGEVFGNGIVKVGYDFKEQAPWMNNTAIEDIYFDYSEPYLQDSEWIFHDLRLSKDKVEKDEKYNKMSDDGKTPLRETVVVGGDSPYSKDTKYKFSSYDKSLTGDICNGKVNLLEGWCKTQNKVITVAPTAQGWRILREAENTNYYDDGNGNKTYFRPFVKLRFKSSPLANRAYDMGAVYPTVKIQKSFNDLINQYFDNVVLINNPMWIKRRGARINPAELVRRAGGVITVGDINQDLKPDAVGDVKQSVIEMLNRLDAEFQQASMVVNLLKGIDNGSTNTATEAQLGQQNVQTLLDMIDENIGDALSELGDMILAIALNNSEGNQTVKMFENDNAVGVLEFDPKNIIGRYDIRITADRSAGTSRVIRQSQLLKFLGIITPDQAINAQYPQLKKKVLAKWLEEAGFPDEDEFFGNEQQAQPGLVGDGKGSALPMPPNNLAQLLPGQMRPAQAEGIPTA